MQRKSPLAVLYLALALGISTPSVEASPGKKIATLLSVACLALQQTQGDSVNMYDNPITAPNARVNYDAAPLEDRGWVVVGNDGPASSISEFDLQGNPVWKVDMPQHKLSHVSLVEEETFFTAGLQRGMGSTGLWGVSVTKFGVDSDDNTPVNEYWTRLFFPGFHTKVKGLVTGPNGGALVVGDIRGAFESGATLDVDVARSFMAYYPSGGNEALFRLKVFSTPDGRMDQIRSVVFNHTSKASLAGFTGIDIGGNRSMPGIMYHEISHPSTAPEMNYTCIFNVIDPNTNTTSTTEGFVSLDHIETRDGLHYAFVGTYLYFDENDGSLLSHQLMVMKADKGCRSLWTHTANDAGYNSTGFGITEDPDGTLRTVGAYSDGAGRRIMLSELDVNGTLQKADTFKAPEGYSVSSGLAIHTLANGQVLLPSGIAQNGTDINVKLVLAKFYTGASDCKENAQLFDFVSISKVGGTSIDPDAMVTPQVFPYMDAGATFVVGSKGSYDVTNLCQSAPNTPAPTVGDDNKVSKLWKGVFYPIVSVGGIVLIAWCCLLRKYCKENGRPSCCCSRDNA